MRGWPCRREWWRGRHSGSPLSSSFASLTICRRMVSGVLGHKTTGTYGRFVRSWHVAHAAIML